MPDTDAVSAAIARDLAADVPMSTILEKCIQLPGRVGNTEVRAWATSELLGYRPTDPVPSYRRIPAAICVSGISGGAVVLDRRIGRLEFPELDEPIEERLEFRTGVRSTELLLQEVEQPWHAGDIKVEVPNAMRLAALIDAAATTGRQLTTEVFYAVAPATLRGVLAELRAQVTALVS